MWCAVQISDICPKLRYFTDQNRPKGRANENEFGLFSNTKMNVKNSKKADEKKWGHLSSFHISFSSYGPQIVHKSAFFANFWPQQNTWVYWSHLHVKALITLFQKRIRFIGVWVTIHEILAIKISKKMLTHQKFNKILPL